MTEGTTKTWSQHIGLHTPKSPFESPIAVTHKAFEGTPAVSFKRFNISGLLVTVYGLEELGRVRNDVACLWLLHGRGDTQDSMAVVASAFLHAWSSKRTAGQKGLICVSFDQRNHGSRMIDPKANDSWKAGNEKHAPDMFSIYSGTAQDVSLLITHLPAYLLFRPTKHICSGISLGGHATWHVILSDARVSAAIIVVGCPDYVRLMTDRAIRSKLPSAVSTQPPGRNFLGSKDFPRSLVEAVEQADPAGLLLGELDLITGDDHLHEPSDAEKTRLRSIMDSRLAGKQMLTLFGEKDRLVPYKHSEPFLSWLKNAINKKGGWYSDRGCNLTDITDPNGGHEWSKLMKDEAEEWLCRLLSERDSKM